jgi:hypothetical protein
MRNHSFRAFQISYLYGYITKICRKQAEVTQNHYNMNVQNIGMSEAQHRKYERLKLGGGEPYDNSNVWTALSTWIRHNVLRSARTDGTGMCIEIL